MKKKYTRWSDCDSDLKRRIDGIDVNKIISNTEFNTYITQNIYGSKSYLVGTTGTYSTIAQALTRAYIDGTIKPIILIQPGEYTVWEPLTIHDNSTVIFLGLGQSKENAVDITFEPTANGQVLFGASDGGIYLYNLYLYLHNSGGYTGIKCFYDSYTDASYHNVIQNCWFHGFHTAIDTGISTNTGAHFRTYIEGCNFVSVAPDKAILTSGSYIKNCYFIGGTDVITTQDNYLSSRGNTFVEDCFFDNLDGNAVYIGGGGKTTITFNGSILDSSDLPATLTGILGYFWDTAQGEIRQLGGGSYIEGQVRVSSNDTNTDYLLPKLSAGTGITLTELNDGGDEQVEIKASGAVDDKKVMVSSNDTTAGYLEEKITSEGTIDITEVNDGGDEDLSLDVNYDGTTIGKNGSSELEVIDDGIVAAKIGTDVDYSVISGNDAATDISGAELEELTDGSDTSLHTHSGLTPGAHGSSHTDGTDDIPVDDSTIGINGADRLAVKDGGIDTSQLANDSVDKDKINSDVAGDMLAQNGDGSLEVDDDDASVASNALDELEIKGFRTADNERILVKTGDAISYATLSQLYGDDNVFVVGPSGYGDYTTIAAALSAASSASPTSSNRMVVMVLPDVYQITSAIAGVQYVDIIGTSRDSCIIDNNAGSAMDTFNPASDSTIANFRLLGNYTTHHDKAFDITGTINNLVIHDIYLEDYRWGITGFGDTWTNFNIYNIHMDDCYGGIACTNLTDSDVRFRNIDIVESTDERTTYGVWNNGSDKWSMWNVRLKGGMSNGFTCSRAGAELRLYGCEVDGADIGYLADGGASIIRANGCIALNCGTNDCKTNNTSAKIYLSGGEYDESTFSDLGTGGLGSKGITGGFFNLNTDSWDDARTP